MDYSSRDIEEPEVSQRHSGKTGNATADSDIAVKPEVPEKPSGWGTMHTFILMTFLARFIDQSLRANLSVAIVAMVRRGN